MTQNPQRILEKVFIWTTSGERERENFGDSRMLFAIDSVSWKVYGHSI